MKSKPYLVYVALTWIASALTTPEIPAEVPQKSALKKAEFRLSEIYEKSTFQTKEFRADWLPDRQALMTDAAYLALVQVCLPALASAAVIIAIGVMLAFAKQIGDFINKHPSMKILALSFLMLIGVLLTAEGFGQHINKGYIYFAMAFALMVELLNIRFRSKQEPA